MLCKNCAKKEEIREMDYLLELGTEELPAKKIASFTDEVKRLLIESLRQKRVKDFSLELFYTPRRIVFSFQGLPEKSQPDEEVKLGPPLSSSKAAIEGFARKYKVLAEELSKDQEKQRFFFREKLKAIQTKEILQESILEVFTQSKLKTEKWMSWGLGEKQFIRPVKWILSLWGKEILELELFGLKAGRRTRAARKTAGLRKKETDFFNWLEIEQASSYRETIYKQGLVEISPAKRKELILQGFRQYEKEEQLLVELNESVLAEVVNLVESPVVLLGEFPAEFLALPDFLIKTVLSVHQRAFVCYDPDTKLLKNKFLIVADCLEQASKNVILGNQRVICARLKDAEFFIQEDLKESLSARKAKLEQIVFQAELPEANKTLASKVERLIRVSQNQLFEESLVFSKTDQLDLIKALGLAKNDLLTNSVFEFTELQGLIGSFIARKQGYSQEISSAIEEHYLPNFLGDQLPSNKLALLISLLDKLDNLFALFFLGKIPSGSADPFALRRQAQGIVQILLSKEFSILKPKKNFSLESLFSLFVQEYQELSSGQISSEVLLEKLSAFFQQRLEFVLSQRFPKELVQIFRGPAVFKRNLKLLEENLLFLSKLSESSELKEKTLYLETFQQVRRISRILKKREEQQTIALKDLEKELLAPAEKELCQSLRKYKSPSLTNTTSWEKLLELREPILKFFTEVLVEDQNNKEASQKRKQLLAHLLDSLNTDFSEPDWDALVKLK